MAPGPVAKTFGIIASILGMLQGLAWLAMSLVDILLFTKVWEPVLSEKTYGSALNMVLYNIFALDYDGAAPDEILITSKEIFAWSIVYLILSLAWFVISSHMCWSLHRDKQRFLSKLYLAWGILTVLISLSDLILASLLATDYDVEVTAINKVTNGPQNALAAYIILSMGIMITIAARGYVLWIINLALGIYLIKVALTWSKQKSIPSGDDQPITINAYGQPNGVQQGSVNRAYNYDNDRPQSSQPNPLLLNPNPVTLPRLPPISSTNERLAKIGRQQQNGGRSSPSNVAPPKLPTSYIYPTQPRVPNPDYSPPNSPNHSQLKSVLKNRMQNPYGDRY